METAALQIAPIGAALPLRTFQSRPAVGERDCSGISVQCFRPCEEEIASGKRGQIRVKGLAYPIATYQLVELRANLSDAQRSRPTEEETAK